MGVNCENGLLDEGLNGHPRISIATEPYHKGHDDAKRGKAEAIFLERYNREYSGLGGGRLSKFRKTEPC